jgi:succinoglycan biosynthesis transport protein ExoP
MTDRVHVATDQRLAAAKAELEQIDAYRSKLNEVLNEQDTATRVIGEDNVNLQDYQFNMQIDQQLHDQIVRRIKGIELEMQRRPRIRIQYPADIASIEDKRVKYSAGIMFMALGCGVALAFLRDKMDKTLQTPDDVTRHLDLPIIGTTTSSRTVKPAFFAEQIAGDYQTIRTNLGLLTSEGMPRKLAVSSAGTREGKTTFAVNLATSLAKSGRKVLLVDGDLRKPDVGHMLSISNGAAGLQDMLLGENPQDIIRVVPSSGLHVLLANPRNLADAYELLTSMSAAEHIEKLSRQYDHLIVDTPPVLAFPDALIWAKLTDAVVLVSFAGQTTAPDLKEANERFGRIRARVLGAVLSNVPVDHSLYRYGYGYRSQGQQSKYKARMAKKLLLPTQGPDPDAGAKKGVTPQ